MATRQPDAVERLRRADTLADNLASLAADAGATDPDLAARLERALSALRGAGDSQTTAMAGNPADVRALVRDVLAEELDRYQERRFGRTP